MSVISGTFDWDRGLIWQAAFAAAEPDDADPPVLSNIHGCMALVDTGATRTCISPAVIQALDLDPVGKASVRSADGVTEKNVYDVHVLVQLRPSDPNNPAAGASAELLTNLRVLEFEPSDSPYNALIGLDILRRGVLTLSSDGHFSFAM
ncbi:retropepsin-like aspartic protease [Candidatus Palauibacter sp.]|uniref:retropepsin-like aspartic protease n=1 Tax=Candidatus Palauibacter sp. TaxID=3101350 RepID=UPI003D1014B4